MILTGRQVKADEALRIGLVDRVVPGGDVLATALELASSLAAGAVVAQALAKQAIDDGLDGTLSDGISLEQELFVEAFGTKDADIGVKAFLSKSEAKFLGQ
jgi:enoyl-CoA hydratase/carnithine racemase